MKQEAEPAKGLYPRPSNPRKTRYLRRTEESGGKRLVGTCPTLTSAEDHPVTVPVPDGEGPWGISLSGGGIRSAAFCLGVLQQMREYGKGIGRGMFEGQDRATYVTSVSGGSYLAGALAVLNRGEFDCERATRISEIQSRPAPPEARRATGDNRRKSRGTDPASRPAIQPEPDLAAFAPGSPEERYLRDRTRYLTHGWGGPLAALWRLLLSICLNVILLGLAIMVVAVPLGWLYGWAVPSLRSSCPSRCAPHNFGFPESYFLAAVALGGLGIVCGLAWVGRNWRREGTRQALLSVSLACLAIAAVWLLATTGLPLVLEWLRVSVGSRAASQPVASPAHSTGAITAVTGGGVAASALVAIFGARVAGTFESGWSKVPAGIKGQLTKKAQTLLLRLRIPLVNLLASLLMPVTVAGFLLLGLHVGALFVPGTGGSAPVVALVAWVGGALVAIAAWLFANLTAWSLHPFYRERLSAAFVLKRFEATPGWSPTAVMAPSGKRVDAVRRPYDVRYPISDAQRPDMPELIVCAAANVSNYGATPTGFNTTSFVFSRSDIGGPLVGAWPAAVYEQVLESVRSLRTTVTLPAAVAISGAAVSPEMGRMTRAPLRFLLTMANLRLGVWIPNPDRLSEFEVRQKAPWRRKIMQPRLTHLLCEMLGKNKPTGKFLYVTDGGHYENLGLIEQLRRRSQYVFCLDASGEQQDGFSTIAGAVALAYSELGIRIDIAPETMAPDPKVTAERALRHLPPVVNKTFCVGDIHYPDGLLGRLVVIKVGVPADAPLDVADFHERNWRFPCDSTIDQLYTAERFDAYRSLGACAAGQALDYCGADFARFRAEHKVPPRFVEMTKETAAPEAQPLNGTTGREAAMS